MHNKPILGLSLSVNIGEYFAEFALIENLEIRSRKRIQHSRENLKQNLVSFLQMQPELKPQLAVIAIRFSKRVIDAQLNEKMGHVITAGTHQSPRLNSQTQSNLTHDDLFVPLQERILATGKVYLGLTDEELERAKTELQESKIKKITLSLMHSGRNPIHLNKAQKFFTSAGFEVFVPMQIDIQQELPTWNRNVLSAQIQSLYDDRLKEVREALQGFIPDEQIVSYTTGDESSPEPQPLQRVFSSLQAVANSQASEPVDVLFLGLEKFVLFIGGAHSKIWKSPWGEISFHHQKQIELQLQPTQCLALNVFGRFDFTKQEEGWDPGPMLLGRGQKMTLLDLWAENVKFKKITGFEDRVQAAGIQRFKNALYALTKVSSSPQADQVLLLKELQSLMLNKLCAETQIHRENKKLLVMGPLASVLANAFKKSPGTSVDTEDFKESFAIVKTADQKRVSK